MFGYFFSFNSLKIGGALDNCVIKHGGTRGRDDSSNSSHNVNTANFPGNLGFLVKNTLYNKIIDIFKKNRFSFFD